MLQASRSSFHAHRTPETSQMQPLCQCFLYFRYRKKRIRFSCSFDHLLISFEEDFRLERECRRRTDSLEEIYFISTCTPSPPCMGQTVTEKCDNSPANGDKRASPAAPLSVPDSTSISNADGLPRIRPSPTKFVDDPKLCENLGRGAHISCLGTVAVTEELSCHSYEQMTAKYREVATDLREVIEDCKLSFCTALEAAEIRTSFKGVVKCKNNLRQILRDMEKSLSPEDYQKYVQLYEPLINEVHDLAPQVDVKAKEISEQYENAPFSSRRSILSHENISLVSPTKSSKVAEQSRHTNTISRKQERFELKKELAAREASLDLRSMEHQESCLSDGVQDVETCTENLRYEKPGGMCVIVNQMNFETNKCETQTEPEFPEREGSDVDAEKMYAIFDHLGYCVVQYNNLSLAEIRVTLNAISRADHSASDNFVLVLLSYGAPGCIYTADRKTITLEEISELFSANNCLSLAGKQKVVIVGACQGSKGMDISLLPGSYSSASNCTNVSHDGNAGEGGNEECFRPNLQDFFYLFSSRIGYKSYRSPTAGSPFIHELARAMKKHSETGLRNIMDITTKEVGRYVIEDGSFKTQLPMLISCSTRDVYFTTRKNTSLDIIVDEKLKTNGNGSDILPDEI